MNEISYIWAAEGTLQQVKDHCIINVTWKFVTNTFVPWML